MNITKDEINWITKNSKPREQAFYTIMRQSGLSPNTIRQLKIKHLEKIREPDTPIPCKIDIPHEIEKNRFGRHPSFIAEESVKDLKKYLTKRELQDKEKLTPESLLFTLHSKPNKQINMKEMNRAFKKTAKKIRHGKSNSLQLNALREFFKRKSAEMGHSHVNYLMGNMNKAPNGIYTPEDDEFYRKLYKELVMDSLEIEPQTPSEIKKHLQKETQELRDRLERIERTVFPKREIIVVDDWEAEAERIEKWVKEHPEEVEWEERWYEQKAQEQEELERLMKHNPDGFVAYTHELKDKVEAIERVFQTTRKQNNQQISQNSNTETTETA